MKDIVIFGTGKISECVTFYFNKDEKFKIAAYCCHQSHISKEIFENKPVVPFERITELYPPEQYCLFIAVGYHELNGLRTRLYEEGRTLGYNFATYISPNLGDNFSAGENTLILDEVIVQPKAKFGNNVFVWGGAMIGHHVEIKDNCWITGSSNIGGLSKIGRGCFLGLNATIGHEVELGDNCLIGASALVTNSVGPNSVVVTRDTEQHRLNADQFLKLTSHF